MAIKRTVRMVEAEDIEDITCDSCGKSTKDRYGMSWEYAGFWAHWGYGSGRDEDVWAFELCEDCAVKAANFLGLKINESPTC